MTEKMPEFFAEKNEAAAIGKDTAEGLITRVHESLETGFFDKAEREEAKRMLRMAGLLSQNPEVKKEISQLLANIENIYGGA